MRKRILNDSNARFQTDEQTAMYFNIGKSTARKLAAEAGAVIYIGKSKRNDMSVLIPYVEKNGR